METEHVYFSDKYVPVGNLENGTSITLLVDIQFENNVPRIVKVNGTDIVFPVKLGDIKSSETSTVEYMPGITIGDVKDGAPTY